MKKQKTIQPRNNIVSILAVFLLSFTTTLSAQPPKQPDDKPQPKSPEVDYVSTYESTGLTMRAPRGWIFMSPSEVSQQTKGAFPIAPNAIFFVVNDKDTDANMNVQFLGDASKDAPNKEAAIRGLRQMQTQIEPAMRQQFPGFKVIKSEIVDFAEGTAYELIFQSKRGDTLMHQRQLMLISNKKGFTITCTAKSSLFDDYNVKGFDPILKSIKIN